MLMFVLVFLYCRGVRCLLKQVDRETALRVLNALLRYKRETSLISPNKVAITISH